MLEHKILYTSDVHGNEKQLKALLDFAINIEPATLIIAGEIAPKGMIIEESGKYIKTQRKFLSENLPEMIKDLKRKLPNANVFVSMGNDDTIANLDVLRHYPDLYTELHSNRITLNKDFSIVGYSCVPITPFAIKDWEKFDLTNVDRKFLNDYMQRKKENYGLDRGLKTIPPHNFINFEFFHEDEAKDSIQLDLMSDIYTQNPEKTIYVFHAPPDNTSLDVLHNDQHVGSFAIREFIEKKQPYVTLHGHIHETVKMSNGKFMDKIGHTISMSAGNNNDEGYVHALVFDAYAPALAKRAKIPSSNFNKLKKLIYATNYEYYKR